jgi:ribosome-associated toxin RatA of RatAB toxin-antitoxin module
MAQVHKTVLIQHSAKRMFDLVDDVTKYPEFLPWCGGVDLLQQDANTTMATLHIAYHGLHQKFTTINTKTQQVTDKTSLMEIKLKDGPFKHLEGIWRFTALNDEACKVEFMLNYEFTNGLIDKMIAPVFSHITNTFVDGFVARADRLYAKDKK